MEHLTDEDIVLMALGEPQVATGGDIGAREHLHTCARCARELAAYRHLVELGRSSADERNEQPTAPPPAVWGRIADELGLSAGHLSTGHLSTGHLGAGHLGADRLREDVQSDQVHDKSAERGRHAADDHTGGSRAPVVPLPIRRRMSRRSFLIAATIAVLAAAGGIAGGIAIGRHTPAQSVAGPSTELAPLPTGPPGVQGNAAVITSTDGATLNVDTQHLPLRQGFYQVWLYDRVADKMVPIGTLGGSGQGSFTLSPSIDLRSYNIVDVSAQDLNGDPAHGDSVLRGILTQ